MNCISPCSHSGAIQEHHTDLIVRWRQWWWAQFSNGAHLPAPSIGHTAQLSSIDMNYCPLIVCIRSALFFPIYLLSTTLLRSQVPSRNIVQDIAADTVTLPRSTLPPTMVAGTSGRPTGRGGSEPSTASASCGNLFLVATVLGLTAFLH